ncbi:hypothetical protein [Haemophilus haemolyticus]|uniref:hypothetical protein n=1 Tax=Haemophilus haemolyticus TaxID=726 RepID=UPI000E57D157|nr:hypothetical protein [Haemophilus haemolyticus]
MASAMRYVAGEVGKDVAAGYKAIPRPYKVAFGIEAGINTAAETIPYATGQKEINGNNILQSGGKVVIDSTYSTITLKAGDRLGFGLDVTKGLAEGKSFGESIGDTTTSFAISKSADKVIKNENIKRIVVGAANKGIEAWKDRNNNEENK